jgi:hypothetical protein
VVRLKQKQVAPPLNAGMPVPAPSATAEREQAAMTKYRARRKKAPPVPRIKLEEGSKIRLTNDHADPSVGYALLMEGFGTANEDFAKGIIQQLVNISSKGREVDTEATNFAVAVVAGIAPNDQVEAMLAAQMAAVHTATMTFARRLAHVETIPQQDSAEKAFNKLARTFAAQVEALKRYRSKGEQRVIVERVTVEKGGQAIVGNVAHGGGVPDESER